jgi:large subunit ribosomal protein L32e
MSKDFKRKDHHKKKRLNESWRRPKGLHNKQRLNKRGHRGNVTVGHRTKASERHTYNGFEIVTVTTTDDIDALNTDEQVARIPSMGKRKKTPLVKHALDQDVTIANLNAEEYVEHVEAYLERRAKKKQARAEKAEAEEAEAEEQGAEEQEEPREETASSDESEDISYPTSNNTKAEIKEWLDEHSIEHTTSMLKDDLLELVEQEKNK